MTASRHWPITDQEEQQIVKLLQLWVRGEIKIRDIKIRTGRSHRALMEIAKKHTAELQHQEVLA